MTAASKIVSASVSCSRKSLLRAAASVHVQSSKIPESLSKSTAALFSAYSGGEGGKVTLPDLMYDYDALEPVISKETMTLHYTKHHNAYVTNLNVGLEKLDKALSQGDISSLIQLAPAVKFNGGGHLNHSLFWQNLCTPDAMAEPEPETALDNAIKESFGRDMDGIEVLKEKMTAETIAVQGSGWGWLGFNKETGLLEIATCSNQDPLQATTGLVPLLGIDVWEHAYYVDYRNVRADYVKKIWNVIHWATVEERLLEAMDG